MLQSAKQLLAGIVKNWAQLAGGTVVAVLGFVADARGWDVPTWVWSTLALGFVGWAIMLAYHELRMQCDAAMDGLTDKRNHRAIADRLTERYRHGVHELAHKAPPHPTTHNDAESFKQAFGEWLAAVFAWNDEVKALMENLGCTPQEISYFWTINELKPGMMLRGDQREVQIRLHATRIDRLWEIIETYAKKSELRP